MIPAVGLIAGAANLFGGAGAGGLLGGAGAGGAFQAALNTATSALGAGGDANAQIQQQMVEAGVQVMGGMMMRLVGEVLEAGMEDEGE